MSVHMHTSTSTYGYTLPIPHPSLPTSVGLSVNVTVLVSVKWMLVFTRHWFLPIGQNLPTLSKVYHRISLYLHRLTIINPLSSLYPHLLPNRVFTLSRAERSFDVHQLTTNSNLAFPHYYSLVLRFSFLLATNTVWTLSIRRYRRPPL